MRVLLSVLVVLLAGCVGPASTSPTEPIAQRPPWHAGLSWEYDVVYDDTATRATFALVDHDGLTMAVSDPDLARWLAVHNIPISGTFTEDFDRTRAFVLHDDPRPVHREDAVSLLRFPLRVGAAWSEPGLRVERDVQAVVTAATGDRFTIQYGLDGGRMEAVYDATLGWMRSIYHEGNGTLTMEYIGSGGVGPAHVSLVKLLHEGWVSLSRYAGQLGPSTDLFLEYRLDCDVPGPLSWRLGPSMNSTSVYARYHDICPASLTRTDTFKVIEAETFDVLGLTTTPFGQRAGTFTLIGLYEAQVD